MWWHQILFKKPFSNFAIGKDLWSSNGGLQQNHQSVTQPLSQTGPPPISWSLPYSFYFCAILCFLFCNTLSHHVVFFHHVIFFLLMKSLPLSFCHYQTHPPSPDPLPFPFHCPSQIHISVSSVLRPFQFMKLLSLFNQAFMPPFPLFSRTPWIVKCNNPSNLVWSRWGSQSWGMLKHFPESRCILIFYWSREK